LINLSLGGNGRALRAEVKQTPAFALPVNFFDRAYQGAPPWDIGRPQREFVQLEEGGEIRGRVLDVGCGTGENALFYAARGHDTWAIDFAPTAIERARQKAGQRKAAVRFEVASALELSSLGQAFDTVTDCGLFHTFLDAHRPIYSASLASVLPPAGRLFVLCFSEREPTDWGGPRRISQAELRSTFADGWKELWIRDARFETSDPRVTGYAWLAAFERGAAGSRRPHRPRSSAKKSSLASARSG
jgi:SAM-dependent methyltransferase